MGWTLSCSWVKNVNARSGGRVNVFKGFGPGKANILFLGVWYFFRYCGIHRTIFKILHINITKSCYVCRGKCLYDVRFEVLSCTMSDHHRPPSPPPPTPHPPTWVGKAVRRYIFPSFRIPGYPSLCRCDTTQRLHGTAPPPRSRSGSQLRGAAGCGRGPPCSPDCRSVAGGERRRRTFR